MKILLFAFYSILKRYSFLFNFERERESFKMHTKYRILIIAQLIFKQTRLLGSMTMSVIMSDFATPLCYDSGL